MIAKIGKGENLYGAISYNQKKIDSENGQVLLLNKIPETLDNTYSVSYLHQKFEPYLSANIRTEKPVRHISLNPDPMDNVCDAQLIAMAKEYMERMGYGKQPYIVFKHTDIERSHIHIVTVCVGIDGKKITDSYDHPRSMAICRDLEQKYNLIPATEKQHTGKEQVFRPVDYRAGDIKSQIASVVRYLPKYYSYQSLGAYNALLSLFNITAEEVKGELNGQPKNGMVYFALSERGEKASNPFKASLFGKQAGLAELQNHFAKSKEQMKTSPARTVLKNTIEAAMHTASNETDFKKQLTEQGINTVVRSNDEGRIYGMTFIDHESRSVWNGSALGKNLSANVFNTWWSAQAVEQRQTMEQPTTKHEPVTSKNNTDEKKETHGLFDFLNHKEQPADDFGLIDGLGGLLPDAQGEDYEEQAFANRMKKKKKRGRKQ
ncbi:relaxase [Elizabethkingia anophelis]|uniref:Relaxase n=1 Tax=Elizabethkingia anophelis TaxID=1117645 RepID=A0A455ZCH4_9FLAO|nr:MULTISPECIES: conjugal transfer protein MobB [Bacteroidota]ASV79766.1 relaxase [Elizabethkingia anophelis]MBB1647405.1 relaxase [Sphingobacterium sp. UME9]MDV3551374.1 relaxase [Elizabethkingia anophelis]MDV3569798.1 relaxase [Elizabethkingia anophelis]MDV3619293.1 relaxase [Elizabethkingia anophelis]